MSGGLVRKREESREMRGRDKWSRDYDDMCSRQQGTKQIDKLVRRCENTKTDYECVYSDRSRWALRLRTDVMIEVTYCEGHPIC